MNIPCENPGVVCAPFRGTPIDPSNPQGNFTSESPDVDLKFASNYGIGRRPPLGSRWYAAGCVGIASGATQAEADAEAARQNLLCLSGQWPVPIPNPSASISGQPPIIYGNRPLFLSHAVVASATCPDGSTSNFVVRAGAFLGFSQAAADATAQSYANRQAVRNRLCLTALNRTSCCLDDDFFAFASATTGNGPVQFSVTSGTLPFGVELNAQNNNTFTLSGSPFIAGDFVFTITATDRIGTTNSRSYTIRIAGISTIVLPNATVGSPYSEFLQTQGTLTESVVWSIPDGHLPDGLSLNSSTGEISGTPTDNIDSEFMVTMTSGTFVCSKSLSINFEDNGIEFSITPIASNCTAGNLEFSGQDVCVDGFPATTPDGYTFTLQRTATGPFTGGLGFNAEMTAIYTGPPTTLYYHYDKSAPNVQASGYATLWVNGVLTVGLDTTATLVSETYPFAVNTGDTLFLEAGIDTDENAGSSYTETILINSTP